MKRLLELKGHQTVQTGRYKGWQFDQLDSDALSRFAKRAPGEPELQKFARTFLALQELEELGKESDEKKEKAKTASGLSNSAQPLAVVPYVASKKMKEEPEATALDMVSSIVKGACTMVMAQFGKWPRGVRLCVALVILYFLLLLLTSPLLAKKCGELTAEIINLLLLRVWEFWETFQLSLLRKLGLAYPEPGRAHYDGHEREDDFGNMQHAHNHRQNTELTVQGAWNQFIHEIGTATFGALCTITGGIMYLAVPS